MLRLLALSLVTVAVAYPSVVFDFMMASFPAKFVGISSIGLCQTFHSVPTIRLHHVHPHTVPTLMPQQGMEYPFSGTMENNVAGYACVNSDEKLHMLADFYISNGDVFFVKFANMDLSTCTPKPFMLVDQDKLNRVNSHFKFLKNSISCNEHGNQQHDASFFLAST